MGQQSVPEFFDDHSSEYQTPSQDAPRGSFNRVKQLSRPKLEFIAERSSSESRFVDIGCGDGAFLEYVVSKTEITDAHGMEISTGMLPDDRVFSISYLLRDATQLPFQENSIDFIHLDAVLHHIVGETRAESKQLVCNVLETIAEVLKPGGYLIITERHQLSRFVSDRRLSKAIFAGLKYGSKFMQFVDPRVKDQQPPICFYTESELRNLIARNGGRVIGSDYYLQTELPTVQKLAQKASKRVSLYARFE